MAIKKYNSKVGIENNVKEDQNNEETQKYVYSINKVQFLHHTKAFN